jgi:glutamine cyclotransferase
MTIFVSAGAGESYSILRTVALRISACVLALLLSSCSSGDSQPASIPVYGYEVVHTYPHDRTAFTQGLVYVDGFLYEGTGLNGKSSLRKVKLETGEVVQERRLPDQYFGEGITDWNNELLQLTYHEETGFVYDRATFDFKRTFRYRGEGWGLTHDAARIIMSDGSSTLRFWNPATLEETGRLNVMDGETAISNLNELEWVGGEIYANIWQTDRIARISPTTGRVTGWIDLQGLLSDADRSVPVDVLNGIAYDAQHGRLFVTGKLWPKLFEIKLIRRAR